MKTRRNQTRRNQKTHLIVEAGWQGTKVRWFTPILIMVGIACCIAAIPTYQYATTAGGALAPFWERVGLAALLVSVGVLSAGGMIWYSRIYVLKLSRSGDWVRVVTPGVVRPLVRQLHASRFAFGRQYDGRIYNPYGVSVNAPWVTLRVAGWLSPLLVDLQSETIHQTRMDQFLRDAAGAQSRLEQSAEWLEA